jgi:hypothetical protein
MRRPLLVTIISIVMIVVGAAQIVFGAGFIAARNDLDVQRDADLTSSQINGLGIALIVLGVLSILLAIGLLRGSRLARALVGLFELVQIAGGIYGLIKFDADRRPSAIGGIVGAVIVLYFLFGTEKAKAYFA